MAVDIAQLLAFAVKNNASDLHLSAGVPPMIRVDGDMKRVNMPALVHKEVHSMVYDIMNDKQRKAFEEFYETDFSFEIPKLARFRATTFNPTGATGRGTRQFGIRPLAYQLGGEDHRPYRRRVPGSGKRDGPGHDVREPARGDFADLDEAGRRRPYCGARNHDWHARHPKLDSRRQNCANVFRHPDRPGPRHANPRSVLTGIGCQGCCQPRGSEVQGAEQGQYLNGTRTSHTFNARSAAAHGREEGLGSVHYRRLSARDQDRRGNQAAIGPFLESGAECWNGPRHHERSANQRIRRNQGMQFRHRTARYRALPRQRVSARYRAVRW